MPRFRANISFEYNCDKDLYGIDPNHPDPIAEAIAMDKKNFERFDILMMILEDKDYKVEVEELKT